MKVESKFNVGDVVYGAWFEGNNRFVITGPLTISETHITAKHIVSGEKVDITYKAKDYSGTFLETYLFTTLNEAVGFVTTKKE